MATNVKDMHSLTGKALDDAVKAHQAAAAKNEAKALAEQAERAKAVSTDPAKAAKAIQSLADAVAEVMATAKKAVEAGEHFASPVFTHLSRAHDALQQRVNMINSRLAEDKLSKAKAKSDAKEEASGEDGEEAGGKTAAEGLGTLS